MLCVVIWYSDLGCTTDSAQVYSEGEYMSSTVIKIECQKECFGGHRGERTSKQILFRALLLRGTQVDKGIWFTLLSYL